MGRQQHHLLFHPGGSLQLRSRLALRVHYRSTQMNTLQLIIMGYVFIFGVCVGAFMGKEVE